MRVAHQLLRSAAAAGLVSLAAACVIPPPGVGPRPEEAELPAPDVAFYNFDEAPYGAGSGILAYSVTREAYAAAFEVDQRGRVRVLAPSSPRDQVRTVAGKNYLLFPLLRSPDREFLSSTTDFSRVPYVFVLTSDTPLDLSAFGTGRTWAHELATSAAEPEATVLAVAARVLADAPAYGSDYAYVGPVLRGGERQFVAACARPLEDVHDYNYYRDMWAVFTPADERLSLNTNWLLSPALGWTSYSLLPLAAYRAEFARDAFYPGCAGASGLYGGSLAYGGSLNSSLFGAYGLYGAGGWYGYGRGVATGFGSGYGTGYGWGYGRTGIVVAAQPDARQTPTLRVPRIPLSFTTPQVVSVASGGGAAGGRALAGPAGNTFDWRSWGAVRRPGEVQAIREGFAMGDGRPSPFHRAERPGLPRDADQRPTGMGYLGVREGRLPTPIHRDAPATSGQTAGRPPGSYSSGASSAGSSGSGAFRAGGGGGSTVAAPPAPPSPAPSAGARIGGAVAAPK